MLSAEWPRFSPSLFGISCGCDKTLQKIGEPAGNSFFQDVTIVVTKTITDADKRRLPEFLCLIGWYDIHLRNSWGETRHPVGPSRRFVLNSGISVFVPPVAAPLCGAQFAICQTS
jgi:hypothetical protein